MMLPWNAMLQAALSVGIAPAAFWQLSLREWRMLARTARPALSRACLAALMENNPDTEGNVEND
jgi:Phage tail assembly chaperone protein, TAC